MFKKDQGPCGLKVLERGVPLRESRIWNDQTNYFENQGIEAWSGQVPFYVTSNPFIANSYANTAIRFIQDCVKNKTYNATQPFYIIELGTGSGQFSYYTMSRLFELQKNLGLDKIDIRYVMTDFTEANVKFWESHPCFQELLKNNQLDFALFNLEVSKDITLIRENKTLTNGTIANPLIIVANYIFDTVSHDAFHVKNRRMHTSLTKTTTPVDNLSEDGQLLSMGKLTVKFEYKNINASNYYDDKELNAVLADYEKTLNNTNFLMPVGAIKCLRTFMDLTNKNFLLLSSDKAYAHLFELENLGDPQIASHGSFSLMVNCHALGEYFLKHDGDVIHQSPRQGLKSSAFLLGQHFDQLPETSQAIDAYLTHFGPADYLHYHQFIRELKKESDMKTLATHLNFCRWDPHVLRFIISVINEKIMSASTIVQKTFIEGMKRTEDTFYYMPGAHDILFDIGLFFHTLQNYEKSLYYYQLSQHYFGEQFATLGNIGHSLYSLCRLSEALETFKKALAIQPDSEEVQSWIKQIESEL